jgi:uncharacterized protein YhaN
VDRQLPELERKLEQALSDLGLASDSVLRRTQPILETQVTLTKQQLAELDEQLKKMRDEQQLVGRDADGQRLRQRQLAAEGEVVTAETLRMARSRRDDTWALIRSGYIEQTRNLADVAPAFDPGKRLPDAFESTMSEADRQADLLRADAKRAAGLEECSVRIAQMEARWGEIDRDMAALAARRGELLAAWAQRLREAGLPQLDPDILREWQGRRYDALQLAERVAALRADRDRLVEETCAAASSLAGALQASGCPLTKTTAAGVTMLPSLIEQAVRWERSAVEAEADRSAKRKAAYTQRVEREKVGRLLADTEAESQRHVSVLQGWHARLFLPSGTVPDAVKARLCELDTLVCQASSLSDAKQRQAHVQAILDELSHQSMQLALLLGETIPQAAEDFADRLRARLAAARAGEHERNTLLRDRAKAQMRQRFAESEMVTQQSVLTRLCTAAGAGTLEKLPEIEEAAARKREALKSLLQSRQQIAAASSRSEEQLRQRLSGLDALAIEAERAHCREQTTLREQALSAARQAEEQTRRALESVDSSDRAALAREAMEAAAARYRSAIRPWARLKLARALLQESLNRFRERAQGPMVTLASSYFCLITGGLYERLVTDDTEAQPVLCAVRAGGSRIKVEEMSEGTADQLYLALRLAALELRRTSHPQMPLVLDDALITSDDERAANILRALARFAEGGQVMIFTHHRHLLEVARAALGDQAFLAHHL